MLIEPLMADALSAIIAFLVAQHSDLLSAHLLLQSFGFSIGSAAAAELYPEGVIPLIQKRPLQHVPSSQSSMQVFGGSL